MKVGENKFFILNNDNWYKFNDENAIAILTSLTNQFVKLKDMNIKASQLSWCEVPFYKNLRIIRFQPRKKDGSNTGYFICTNDYCQVNYLDGTSHLIHNINAKGLLDLSGDNLIQYLMFFCFFVHGDKGPFLIIDSIKNQLLKKIDEKFLKKYIFPIESECKENDDRIVFKTPVIYSNVIFKATFHIHETGMIEMLEDEPLGELPSGCNYQPVRFPELKTLSVDEEDVRINTDEKMFKFIDIKALIEKVNSIDEQGKHIYKNYLDKLTQSKGYLPLATLDISRVERGLERLYEVHPQFSNVIDYIGNEIMLSTWLGDGVLDLESLIFESKPGVGKTRFVHDLAAVFSVPYEFINCANLSSGIVLTGLSPKWRGGSPGRITQFLLKSGVGNSIAVLDEVDKKSLSQENNNAEGPLLNLLEKKNAEYFFDEGLDLKVNLRHLNIFATCNEIKNLSDPVQSRFKHFKIDLPNEAQRVQILHSIYHDIVTENPWGKSFKAKLESEVAEHIASIAIPPRLAKRLLHESCVKAAFRYKKSKAKFKKIVIEPKDVLAVKFDLPEKKRKIGFVN